MQCFMTYYHITAIYLSKEVWRRHVGSGMKVDSHFFCLKLPLSSSPLTCGEIKRNIVYYRTGMGKVTEILRHQFLYAYSSVLWNQLKTLCPSACSLNLGGGAGAQYTRKKLFYKCRLAYSTISVLSSCSADPIKYKLNRKILLWLSWIIEVVWEGF